MSCYPHTIQLVLPAPSCPDSGTYTASNANLTGEGVFFQQVGNQFQFFGVSNSDGYITVNTDLETNSIVLGIDPALIAGSIPDSTTTVKGKTAYSTDAQAQAKSSTTKALTPSNLAALAASTVFAGLTEYATNAETQAGVSTSLAVTPAGLNSVTSTMLVTQVVANQPARETAVPAAAGQLLFQRDTGVLYYADTTGVGDFQISGVPLIGSVNLNGDVTIGGGYNFILETNVKLGGVVNFDVTGGNLLHRNGVVIPANSILLTSGTDGELSYIGANNFVGQYAVETYAVSNYTDSRTFDAASATPTDTANTLATLIADLAATKKPQL